MSSKNHSILFLHWGPGASSEIESKHFKTLPIHWWNQPRVFPTQENLFEQTVQAAEREVAELYRSSGAPIQIIAHSSGGRIAVELLRRQSETKRIGKLLLLSSSCSPPMGLVRLGEILSREKMDPELGVLAQQARASLSSSTFWPMIQKITQYPDFIDRYWQNTAAKEAYNRLASDSSPMDMGVFAAIMDTFLQNQKIEPLPSIEGLEVKVVLGAHDPLIDVASESESWRKVFPGCRVITLETGHFPHFEAPIESWLT